MCHKLYLTVSEIMGRQKLSGVVKIDALHKSINLKGI